MLEGAREDDGEDVVDEDEVQFEAEIDEADAAEDDEEDAEPEDAAEDAEEDAEKDA